MSLTSDEINFLIYRYLRESGFEHSAYAFGHESFIYKSTLESSSIPPGALISFVQKGLQYAEIESHINEDGTETICEESFTLMKKHQCKPRAAKRKIFSPFDSLDADYGALEIDDARMLRTSLDPTKGDHIGTSGLKNMSVCVLWHPFVPAEKNSKRGNPLAEQQRNTLLTAMADGAIKIWEWREEEEVTEEQPTQPTDTTAAAASSSSASSTTPQPPKVPFQKGFVCVRTIVPPCNVASSAAAAAASSDSATAQPAAPSSNDTATKMEDVDPSASSTTGAAASTSTTSASADPSASESNKRQKLSDGTSLPLNGILPAAAASSSSSSNHDCNVNTNQSIVAIDWHPRGASFSAASYSGTAYIYSPKGLLLHTLSSHTAPVTCMRYNHSGSFLITASVDHTVCLWDTETGALRRRWHVHSGPVLDLDWSPVWQPKSRDGQQPTDSENQYRFASCGTDGMIFVMDVRDEDPASDPAASSSSSSSAIASSPSSRYSPRALQGHEGEVNSVSFDPSGTLILSCSDDASAKIWNAQTGDIIHDFVDHEKEVLIARWSGTGPFTDYSKFPLFVATGSTDTTVKLFDPQNGACLHTLTQHTHPVSKLAFAPRQHLLATASHERVFIWSLHTGQLVKTFKNLGDPLIQTPNHIPLGHVGGLNDLAFDSRGEQIALSYADGMTYVLDLHDIK